MPAPHPASDRASAWLHPEQIESLRTACYDECFRSAHWQRNEAMVTVLYDAGLRVSELGQLDVAHLDTDAGTVQVPDSEASETRAAPPDSATLELDPEQTLGTARLLTSYLHHRDDDGAALFPSRNGGRLTPKAIRDVVSKAAESAGVRPHTPTGRGGPADVSPHTLRHSTAWRLLAVEKRSLAEVRDRLRHTDLGTTRSLYASFTDGGDGHAATDAPARETVPEREILEEMLDAVPDILFAFDTDGQMLWWNPRVTAITGYRDAEIAEMRALDFVAPADRGAIAETIARVVDRETAELEEAHLVTSDGEYLPYEFTGAPLTDDDGAVWGVAGVGRDVSVRKRFERISDGFYTLDTDWRFTSLNSRAEALFGRSEESLLGTVVWEQFSDDVEGQYHDAFHTAMETQEPVSFDQYHPAQSIWVAVRAYPSRTGLSVYFEDVTARKERERKLDQFQTLTEAANDVIVTIDAESVVRRVNPAVEDVFGYEPDEVVGEPLTVLMSGDAAERHRTALRRYLETDERTLDWPNVEVTGRRADGTAVPLSISFSEAEYDGQRYFTGIVRDITDQRERERELERQRTALAELDQFNALVHDLVHAVVEESTREEIEQTVCDQLAAADRYRMAWVGERTRGADGVAPRTSAGVDVDAVATGVDSGRSIAERAAEDRDVCVRRPGSDDPLGAAGARRRDPGDAEAALAVPIEYGDASYGVLAVYATDATAFGERQRASFADLGETIGFAIAAAERKAALVAEHGLELTLSVRTPDRFFTRAATRFDAAVSLEGITERESDAYLEYFTVSGASPSAIRDLAARVETVEHVRVVSGHENGCLCEVAVADASIPTTVAEYGGAVTAMTAEGECGTVRVELPRTADVSRVVDALAATVDDVELQAKGPVDRPLQTQHRFEAAVTDRMTDKQRNALEAAYLAGFFEQPRDSTGEDVAESLGIAPSTFHQHLRVGLRKLIGPIAESSTNRS